MSWQGPRQKDYPKEILVGDSFYKIKFVRRICHAATGTDMQTLGTCCPDDKEILILQGLDPMERLSTLVHELLHALEFEYEIEIPHKLIYQLERPITQLLMDNQP